MSIREPHCRLVYEGRDITDDLAMWPTSIGYTDKLHGESDEARITVHNSDLRWLDEWAPNGGDRFTLDYGYRDELVPAGQFVVDEVEAEGDAAGDKLTFKGLSAPKTQSLRTPRHAAYEDQDLSQIVDKIARQHGFTVTGEIEDIHFDRVTQNGERDLEFLRRLADDYGHYFSARGDQVVFMSRDALRSMEPVRTIDLPTHKGQLLKRYRLRLADHAGAARAEVRYLHARRKKVISGDATSVEDMGLVTASGDVIKTEVRVENDEQARRVARSRLDSRNSKIRTGEMTLVGDPRLVAGVVIALTGFGIFNGRWIVTGSSHPFARSGYETGISIEAVTDKQRSDGSGGAARRKKKGKSASSSSSNGVVDMGRVNADGSVTK